MAGAGRRAGLALTVLATVAADRMSKEAATRLLAGRPPVEWLGGLARFELAANRGAFLGLGGRLPNGIQFAALVAAVGLALVAAFAWLLRQRNLPARRAFGAALTIGGGLANLLDRLPDGTVTDFLVVGVGSVHTGIFNLADAAILAGALGLCLPARPANPPER